MPNSQQFSELADVAQQLRGDLQTKRFLLLYAYNGRGKTRLSGEFKNVGKVRNEEGQAVSSDTLYFNAFTEDLFTWDNDLENDQARVLEFNSDSKFFDGVRDLEMEVKIGKLLERYADFSFAIDYDRRRLAGGQEIPAPPAVTFFRERDSENAPIPIKISRGEENIFIWCWFLANLQIALDGAESYNWVKYIYIDDPVSSLDEHNVVVVANHLSEILRESNSKLPVVVSTHHHLFFNVLHFEMKGHLRGQTAQYWLSRLRRSGQYWLESFSGDTPSFHHVALLIQLYEVAQQEEIHTYHFNILRTILEKTALFNGYTHFSRCIKQDASDSEGVLHQRFVDLLSHGKYSLYEPNAMGEETKEYFRTIIRGFLERFPFNPDLFSGQDALTPNP